MQEATGDGALVGMSGLSKWDGGAEKTRSLRMKRGGGRERKGSAAHCWKGTRRGRQLGYKGSSR